jgi:hypothetical protein
MMKFSTAEREHTAPEFFIEEGALSVSELLCHLRSRKVDIIG